MKQVITLNDFSKHLFWDVDVSLFDIQKNREQLVFKVLEYGTIKDWKLLQQLFSLQEIQEISLNLRSLDVVTLSFLSSLFDIDKSEFRCYKSKQLVQNYWNS
jgi:hypothetical protein